MIPHKADPITGTCIDCGMVRHEIADNLFGGGCEPGPHALAITALRRSFYFIDVSIAQWREQLEAVDRKGRALLENWIAEGEERIAALKRSLDVLRRDGKPPQEDRIELAKAVRRL